MNGGQNWANRLVLNNYQSIFQCTTPSSLEFAKVRNDLQECSWDQNWMATVDFFFQLWGSVDLWVASLAHAVTCLTGQSDLLLSTCAQTGNIKAPLSAPLNSWVSMKLMALFHCNGLRRCPDHVRSKHVFFVCKKKIILNAQWQSWVVTPILGLNGSYREVI